MPLGDWILKALRILMLEDEPLDYELVRKALTRSGVEFSAARVETREDFSRELERMNPDVVLSDHGLPQFDGLSALRLVRAVKPETPFIFVAGALGEQTVIESFDLGATDYVLKSRLHDLRPAIDRALGNKLRPTTSPVPAGMDFDRLHLFKCAVEQTKESVVITTPQLDLPGPVIVYVNKSFTEMTGYPPEEVIGKTPRILHGPKTDRRLLREVRAKLERGEIFEGETINYRKDGSEFTLQWEITPIRDARGQLTHYLSIQRDVTEQRRTEEINRELERKAAEQTAREKQERVLSQMLNRVTDAFVSLDAEWRYTFVNQKAAQILGSGPKELIGKCIWDIYPGKSGEPFRPAYERAMAQQVPVTIEGFYEPWGKWFENRLYPSPEGLFVFFQDVTEQRKRREELQASLNRFELATRVVQDVIYDWDIKGERIRWNQNYYSVFQYDSSEAEQDVALWAQHLHPEDRERVEHSLTAALGGKAHYWQIEYRFERGDGTYADVFDRGYIVRDSEGKAERMVGGMVDVSVQQERNRSLYATTQKVTAILESITDAFISLDREWRFTYVNNQAEKLLGRARDELIGRSFWREFPESVGSVFEKEYHRAVEDRVTVKFEVYYKLLGSWLFVSGYPSPDGLSIYFHDITDRKRSEEALRASEEFSRRIIQSSSDCIKILDLDGRLLGMTEGGQRLMEIRDLSPYLGELWIDFWQGEHQPDALKALAEARAGRMGRFQGSCPTMTGKQKYWDVICTAILGPDGKPREVLSISRDITSLKDAEEGRRRVEARKEAIFRSALDAIITIDHQSKVQDWNPAAEQIFGYAAEEVIGKSMVDFIIPPEFRERHKEALQRAQDTASEPISGRRYEFSAQRANGEIFPAEISIIRIPTEGTPLFTGFVRDISQRKWAETQLRQQEERLRLIVETAQDYAIFTMDMEGRVTSWNSGAEKILQYPRDEAIGKSGSIIFTPEDLANGEDKAEIETTLAHGRAADERWHVRKGGERFWASGQMRGLEDDKGSIRGFLKILRDETAQRQAREEIERLNAELEQRVQHRTADLEAANRELEAFSYSVSHDLRAPLRHIKAFEEMLEETVLPKLDADEKQYLQTISASAEKMAVLIDDLLSFSRMLRAEVAQETFPLNNVVDTVIESFELETRGRDVHWNIGQLPVVHGDQAMLRQVMTNLISNALKYTRDKPQVRIEIGAQTTGNEHVIHVRDNGVGFDQGNADKLFGIFQRLHSDREFEGTGIGLANVRRIVERHKGRVWAEGELGQGATFYFTVPKNVPTQDYRAH